MLSGKATNLYSQSCLLQTSFWAPGSQRGDRTSHLAMVTYYLGSSYGGTVTSGPQPQPSPPQPWKREYRSSTLNRNKGCSQMHTNGRVKTSKSQHTWAPPSTARPTMEILMGSGRTWFPGFAPLGESSCKEAKGNSNEGLRAASLHCSPLQDGSKHRGPAALCSMCVLEVGMLLLHWFSARPCDFQKEQLCG